MGNDSSTKPFPSVATSVPLVTNVQLLKNLQSLTAHQPVNNLRSYLAKYIHASCLARSPIQHTILSTLRQSWLAGTPAATSHSLFPREPFDEFFHHKIMAFAIGMVPLRH